MRDDFSLFLNNYPSNRYYFHYSDIILPLNYNTFEKIFFKDRPSEKIVKHIKDAREFHY